MLELAAAGGLGQGGAARHRAGHPAEVPRDHPPRLRHAELVASRRVGKGIRARTADGRDQPRRRDPGGRGADRDRARLRPDEVAYAGPAVSPRCGSSSGLRCAACSTRRCSPTWSRAPGRPDLLGAAWRGASAAGGGARRTPALGVGSDPRSALAPARAVESLAGHLHGDRLAAAERELDPRRTRRRDPLDQRLDRVLRRGGGRRRARAA